VDAWSQEGDRETGKAGSGAEVQESGGAFGEMAGGEEAFSEVAADDLFRVADGGEVGVGVPLEEEVEIEGELGDEARRDVGEIGAQELVDCGFWERGHGWSVFRGIKAVGLCPIPTLATMIPSRRWGTRLPGRRQTQIPFGNDNKKQ